MRERAAQITRNGRLVLLIVSLECRTTKGMEERWWSCELHEEIAADVTR